MDVRTEGGGGYRLPDAARPGRVRLRARRQLQYLALREKPCATKDGVPIASGRTITVDWPLLARYRDPLELAAREPIAMELHLQRRDDLSRARALARARLS